MADINDLVHHAVEKNPTDFADAFNAIMHDRCVDAIANRKVELAQSLYGTPETTDVDNDSE